MAHKELVRRLAIIRDLGGDPKRAVAAAIADGQLTTEVGDQLLVDLRGVRKSRSKYAVQKVTR